MTYYITVFLLYYACAIYAFWGARKRQYIASLVGMAPLILLVALRGDVGTDTASYLQIIAGIRDTGEAVSGWARTPIHGWGELTVIVKGLLYFTKDPRVIIAILTLITSGILIYASLHSVNAMWVFAFCLVPIFYLDMTMNGLRYGLAFAVATFAISHSYRGHWLTSGVLQAIAVFMHVSALALFIITWLCSNSAKQKKHLLITMLFVCIAFGAYIYLANPVSGVVELAPNKVVAVPPNSGSYFVEKIHAYSQFQSPSLLSGLAPLFLSICTLVVLHHFVPANRVLSRNQFFGLLGSVVMTFVIAKITYAGLRMQYVVLFAIIANLQYKPEYEKLMTSKKIKFGLALVGLAGLAFFFRGIINTEGIGSSPFLPYRLNPDLFSAQYE